jgi:Putative Ig domain/Glucodextranase, domain B
MALLREQITVVAALLLLSPIVAHAQTLTIIWDPNPSADQVTGYEVCIGTASLSCNFRRASVPATETAYVFTPNAGVLYYVAVRAVSAAGAGAYAPEITVSTPSLNQPANQTSTVNTAISPLSLSASDPDGDTLRFSHTGLPFGLTLNQSTGIITGTPTSTGTFNVTVFVADNLVPTSRSFVWTVTSGGSSDTQPSVAITSHTSGQTVTTSSITLAGTASDSGLGNSGIASVTVNGAAATGGTATGSGTANWSRSVALSSGSNTLTVVATDGAGNTRSTQITITSATYAASIPPMGASLSQNLASPQTTGTAITFTASGSGGVGPYEYQWYLQLNGGAQTMVRAWSTATSYAWTPTQAGTYVISIWARSAGTTTNAAQATAQRTILINASVTSGTGVVARDTFTGSAGTWLTTHAPDVSPGSLWVQRQGATVLQSGRVAAVSTNVGYGLATLEAGAADGSVVVDVISTGNTPFGGIVFRALDTNRLLLLRYAGNASIGLLGLFRRVNGSFELIDQITTAAIASGSTHRLGVQLNGSQVQATWDGAVVLTRTVTDYQTATQHGLLWHSDDPSAQFDNFAVTASGIAPSPPPPTNGPPLITGPSNQSHTTGTSVSVQIVASDPEGSALQYGASGLPAGVSVNTSTGVMSGTITASAGTYTVTTTASDGTTTATRTFIWTVTARASTALTSGFVVRDTFTGSSGTAVTAHAPDASPGSMWVQRQGAIANLVNGGVGEVSWSSGYGLATLESGAADGSVTVDMRSNGSTPFGGIVFRVVDTDRMLLLRFSGNASVGLIGLFRRVSGSFELIHQVTVSPIAPGSTHRLGVDLVGNQVRATWDGNTVFTRTVTDYQTATNHGLLWHSDDPYAYFDNFTVTAP